VSGGSYDYLCWRPAGELGPEDENLTKMVARLEGIDRHSAAAVRTRAVQAKLRDVQVLITGLAQVWRAVEWRDSGDWSAVQLRAALDKHEAANTARRRPPPGPADWECDSCGVTRTRHGDDCDPAAVAAWSAPSTSGWTSHGWWVGDAPEPATSPILRARCTGPRGCSTCRVEHEMITGGPPA
jgi:hypothetical protein